MEKYQSENQEINSRTKSIDNFEGQKSQLSNEECSSCDSIGIDKEQEPMLEIPIYSKYGLYLVPTDAANAERFANLFAEVWLKIRWFERDYMFHYWNSDEQWLYDKYGHSSALIGCRDENPAFGINDAYIKFDAALVDNLSDLELKTEIAYQLASILRQIDVYHSSFQSLSRRFCNWSVGKIMKDWGYPPSYDVDTHELVDFIKVHVSNKGLSDLSKIFVYHRKLPDIYQY